MPESRKPVTRSHPSVFLASLGVAAVIAYPFITPLVLSVITAYVFRPLVRRLEVHTRSYHAALVLLVAFIGAPIILAASYVSANSNLFSVELSGLGGKIAAFISAASGAISATPFGGYIKSFLSAEAITSRITTLVLGLASDFVSGLPFLLLDIVVYLYATYLFMRDGHKIVSTVKAYAATLPVEDEYFVSSISRGLKRSFDVLFLSYITMALVATVASYIGYSVFGVPHAFVLAILTGIFSFLPILGVWMIYVPIAAYMYYAGNVFAATGILFFGLVVLSIFIPLILQPYLGARKTGVSPLSIFIGFFSGPVIFGAKGLLLGPILFVVAETVIREYIAFRIENCTPACKVRKPSSI